MTHALIYDFIGVGIGPFNLGMAALAAPIKELNCLFFDQNERFDWHPGMMIEHTTLQVPFLADLVLPVDPTSPFTFINYLKEEQQIFKFCIREENFITRREYNAYCKWVAAQLPNCLFGHRVTALRYAEDQGVYELTVQNLAEDNTHLYKCRRLVLGMGTTPLVPACAQPFLSDLVFHNSDYLRHKALLEAAPSITVVGSGQSAGEVFHDQLQHTNSHSKRVSWLTRASRFYPMEYARLSHEYTSPDYVRYFYNLPKHKKEAVLAKQDVLYKGMNVSLINAIYDLLYYKEQAKLGPAATLCANSELLGIREAESVHGGLLLKFYHREQEKEFEMHTDALVLATGYKSEPPALLKHISDRICWDHKKRLDVHENYSVDKTQSEIFVLNAELHTHGHLAPDLGMGPYRNAGILNTMLNREHYRLEKQIAFQSFGIPETALLPDSRPQARAPMPMETFIS